MEKGFICIFSALRWAASMRNNIVVIIVLCVIAVHIITRSKIYLTWEFTDLFSQKESYSCAYCGGEAQPGDKEAI